MNNITIGQYIPGNSWLHRLDPRIKLLALVILLVGTFIIPISSDLVPILTMVFIFVGVILLTATSGVPVRKVINGLRPIVFLLTFTFFIQLFYVNTGTLLASYEMYISVTSILAIILFIFFYNWSKKYIKTRILYFFFAVIMIFFLQIILPYISLTSYTLNIYDEGILRAGFIFIRITNVIIMTS
ncbi:MAG: hypothetical protein KKH92_09130, partial [Firmicutes bacterium]|nr:hypothetical protein [Bacillota bacterium]